MAKQPIITSSANPDIQRIIDRANKWVTFKREISSYCSIYINKLQSNVGFFSGSSYMFYGVTHFNLFLGHSAKTVQGHILQYANYLETNPVPSTAQQNILYQKIESSINAQCKVALNFLKGKYGNYSLIRHDKAVYDHIWRYTEIKKDYYVDLTIKKEKRSFGGSLYHFEKADEEKVRLHYNAVKRGEVQSLLSGLAQKLIKKKNKILKELEATINPQELHAIYTTFEDQEVAVVQVSPT